jgi:hypothetical protein
MMYDDELREPIGRYNHAVCVHARPALIAHIDSEDDGPADDDKCCGTPVDLLQEPGGVSSNPGGQAQYASGRPIMTIAIRMERAFIGSKPSSSL